MLLKKSYKNVGVRFKAIVLGVIIAVLAITPVIEIQNLVGNVNAASANDAVGPNRDWLGNDGRYNLQESANVRGAGTQYIVAYIENTGSKTDPEIYPPSNVTLRAFDFSKGYSGGTYSRAQFLWCEGTSRQGNTSYTRSDTSFTIPKECFTYEATTNTWSTRIKASLQNNSGSVNFRLRFISPNNGHQILGYTKDSASASQQGTAVSNRYRCDFNGDTTGCGRFYNYRIPFGTPCSVSSNTSVSAYLYDGDNTTSNRNTSIQYNRNFSVSVYDVTDRTFVSISRSGGEGDNQTARYRFTVKPNHKYQFRIDNVYTNNVLQFRLPYNSIESIADCSWDLTPTVSVNPISSEGGSSNLTVNTFMPNSGASTSKPVTWQLTRCTVNAGASTTQYAKVNDNTSNGVNTYNALGASCSQVSTQSNTTFVPSTTNQIGSLANQSLPDLPPGSRICYVLSVNPPTDKSSSNVWRHSQPACVVIGKKPKVQILGSDVFVGNTFAGATVTGASDIQTAFTTKTIGGNPTTFGSWGEYAAGATGVVTGFGTGSAYSGGASTSIACAVSYLTLTNTQTANPCDSTTVLGSYDQNRILPDISGAFRTTAATTTLPSSVDLSGLNGTYTAPDNLTITGGTIAQGRSVIINAPNSTVTIAGNITYNSGAISSIEAIPQVVIIAQDIRILGVTSGSAVSRVDAWLVASGTVNTCYDANAIDTLTINRCNTVLEVNGPVIANRLELWRTAGSGAGAATGDPAEIFNLRPDAYLWGVVQAANSGRLETVYETELPPRF